MIGVRLGEAALEQVLEWALAWVENETTLPETPQDALTPKQLAGLTLLQLWKLHQGYRS